MVRVKTTRKTGNTISGLPKKRKYRGPAVPFINGSEKDVYPYTYKPCYSESGRRRSEPRSCHWPCRPKLTRRKQKAGANSPWSMALKRFNKWEYNEKGELIERNASFVVPLRGSSDYKRVKAIAKTYKKGYVPRERKTIIQTRSATGTSTLTETRSAAGTSNLTAEERKRQEMEAYYQKYPKQRPDPKKNKGLYNPKTGAMY